MEGGGTSLSVSSMAIEIFACDDDFVLFEYVARELGVTVNRRDTRKTSDLVAKPRCLADYRQLIEAANKAHYRGISAA